MNKVILSLALSLFFYSVNAQKVAIIGYKGLEIIEDGISILALDDLSSGEVYYFTDNEYDNATNAFSDVNESVVKITVTSTITKGNVIYFRENAPSTSNIFTASVTAGSGTVTVVHVATSGPFSLASFGESVYLYTDTDENPVNGITEIQAAFFGGSINNSITGGSMPAAENPSSGFPNAVVVHNFPQNPINVEPYFSNGINRIEFKTSLADRTDVNKVILENAINYVFAGNNQDLSTTKFTNFNLVNSNPVITLTRDFNELNENSSNNFSFTFTADIAPASDLVVNFSVNGSSANGVANFGTDYTQSGATTMNSSSGTVTITGGTTSRTIVINPTGDTGLEPDELIELSIAAGSGYTPGSPSVASATIKNDDVLAVIPEVAITGTRHYTDNEDGVSEFSFVALKDLPAGDSYVFSSNPFNKTTLLFSDVSSYPSALKWTVPGGGISRGDVIVVKKTAPNTLVITRNGSASLAGTIIKLSPSKKFYISQFEGFFRAHTDSDDDPFNGITAIHSQVFTYEVTNGFGGNMPVLLDLSTLYSGSILVDGFANTTPLRLEYKPNLRPTSTVDQANFENPGNWLFGEVVQDLSPVPFNNITISEGSANHKATLSVTAATITEDTETGVFTFNLDAIAATDISINFDVAGTAVYTSDYTVSGANSFAVNSGSIIIPTGFSSAQLSIIPVADDILEKTENISITITGGTGYDGGSPSNAMLSILNDDTSDFPSQLAIIGINHTSPSSISMVAMERIPANSTFYLLRNLFDKETLSFQSGGKYEFITPNNCIPKGTVFTITGDLSGPLQVNCNGTSGASVCGTANIIGSGTSFNFLEIGTRYHVFQDDDNDHTNGIRQIHSVFHTGGDYPANHTGGNLTPEENPSDIYSNVVIVDGFPSIAPDRTEFDPSKRGVEASKSEIENISNYLHGQANGLLSTANFNVESGNTFIVSNTNDNGIGSLRFFVSLACSGDTIRFSPGFNGDTIKLSSGQILVNNSLTIIGNGKDNTIIDGQALDRIFEISAAGSMVLDSLTLQNGDVSSKTSPNDIGGAILAVGDLTINNAVLRENKAALGGAIASSSSSNDIFINASTFSDNEAVNQGGVIAFLGDTLSVESSTFSTNSASDAGVFYLLGSSNQTVLIDKSTFSGNTATSYAGAIYKENGKMEITNSTFFENSALVGAGALYIATGTAEIQNSIFKNTAPTDSDIFKETGVVFSDLGNNLVFSSAGAHGTTDGNGIDPLLGPLADNGGLTKTHALLCGSPAYNTGTGIDTDQRGKAVFGGTRDIGAFESQIFLDGSSPNTYIVTNTNDDGVGSLRYLVNNACAGDTIRFDAAIDGDTIKLASGQILINKNLVIIGNDSTKTIIDGQANSRVFEISSSINIAISKLTLQNGLTTSSGGTILNSGNLKLADIKLLNSKALSGGAIYNNRNINISNSVVAGNEATNNGGGIYSLFGQINIKNSIIKGNKALSDGGGLFNDGNASTFIWYSTIAGNEAGGNGGGIVEAAGNTLKLYGTLIANNNAGTGGKDLHYTVGNIVDEGFNFVKDAAGGHGITDGNGIDPLFMQNVPAAPSIGGDLRLQACSPAIDAGTTDTTGLNLGLVDIEGNSRVFEGRIDIGAYEFQAAAVTNPLLVVNTNDNGCGSLRYVVTNAAPGDTIRFDVAIDGDTIKLSSGEIALNKNLIIEGNGENSTIIDGQENSRIFYIPSGRNIQLSSLKLQHGNGAGVQPFSFPQVRGGAIYNRGNLSITNCIISENTAFWGGGVSTESFNMKIINSTISGNTASNGGGVYCFLSSAKYVNTLISGNQADIGGGILAVGGSLNFINSTLSGNNGITDGGGLSLSNGTVSSTSTLTNTIVANNNSGGSGKDILKGTSVSLINGGNNYVLTSSGGHGITDGNGIDPLFIQNVPTAPSIGGDLRLQPCSPAINAGTTDTTGLNLGLVDLAGNPRVLDDRIDIGAFERSAVSLEITNRILAEFNEVFACENGIIKLPARISSPDFTYQWQIDQGSGFSNLSEASPYSQTNADSLVIFPIGLNLDGYQYRALIADACGGSIISDTITLRVGQLPVLVTSPLTQEVCPGNEVVLEAGFSGGGFYYQWQVDEGSGFVNVSGSEYMVLNDKLLISNFDNSKNNNQYRAVATSSCFAIPSNAATITINTDVTILAQPTSQSVCEFGTAIFTAQAVKLTPGILTYQWQRKAGTGNWIDVNTGGRYVVNGNQLQITNAPASWNGAEFRCLMNDYCQTIPKTLNVIPVAHVTQNPVNQEICVGNNANFSVTAAGEGLTYRWQVNAGSGFVNLTDGGIYQGATSANLSLSFPTAAVNSYQYRCVVSGTSTCDLAADTSAVASISIGVSAEAQTVFYNSSVTTDEGITQAVAYILGINKILQPNGKAEYRAGNAIILNPGFEVEAGAVFTAKIMNPCMSVSTSSAGGGSVPKELVK